MTDIKCHSRGKLEERLGLRCAIRIYKWNCGMEFAQVSQVCITSRSTLHYIAPNTGPDKRVVDANSTWTSSGHDEIIWYVYSPTLHYATHP